MHLYNKPDVEAKILALLTNPKTKDVEVSHQVAVAAYKALGLLVSTLPETFFFQIQVALVGLEAKVEDVTVEASEDELKFISVKWRGELVGKLGVVMNPEPGKSVYEFGFDYTAHIQLTPMACLAIGHMTKLLEPSEETSN